jgi:hypothetical protein
MNNNTTLSERKKRLLVFYDKPVKPTTIKILATTQKTTQMSAGIKLIVDV